MCLPFIIRSQRTASGIKSDVAPLNASSWAQSGSSAASEPSVINNSHVCLFWCLSPESDLLAFPCLGNRCWSAVEALASGSRCDISGAWPTLRRLMWTTRPVFISLRSSLSLICPVPPLQVTMVAQSSVMIHRALSGEHVSSMCVCERTALSVLNKAWQQ